MLMMLPVPCPCMARTWCFMLRITPRTFVSNVAAYVSAVWSVIGPTWPSVPALFTATSRRPNRATVLSTRARTSSSVRTSALINSASEPKERSSLTSALPAPSRRPATTTFAPFLAKATAAARPIPVKAPVIKTTGLPIVHSPALAAEHGSYFLLRVGCRVEGDMGCPGACEKDFVRWGACLGDMEGHGATAPPLVHRSRRGGRPDALGRQKAAHGAAVAKPADSGSGVSG